MGLFGSIFFVEEIARAEAFKATLTKTEEIAEVDRYIKWLRKMQEEADTISDK